MIDNKTTVINKVKSIMLNLEDVMNDLSIFENHKKQPIYKDFLGKEVYVKFNGENEKQMHGILELQEAESDNILYKIGAWSFFESSIEDMMLAEETNQQVVNELLEEDIGKPVTITLKDGNKLSGYLSKHSNRMYGVCASFASTNTWLFFREMVEEVKEQLGVDNLK